MNLMKISMKIIVLAKQVPDTRSVGPDAMTPQGTVNRAALPAIFNPEDLNALEMALQIKDSHPETHITVLTMGLPKATEILREALYRGADDVVLLTDRALGGADTLATSYALSKAIRKIGQPDLILCGRQAIDGDTAQVGPQVAEKLSIPQVTCVENVILNNKTATVTRRIDGGIEVVEAPMPCLLTVTGTANECRPQNARRVMIYKKDKHLPLSVWSAEDIDADRANCGLAGSPTKVKNVQNIVFKAKESKRLTDAEDDINNLIHELLESHTLS